jgi:epoxyqueuosine reductase QueG
MAKVIEMIEMVQDFGPVFRLGSVLTTVDFDHDDRNRKCPMALNPFK